MPRLRMSCVVWICIVYIACASGQTGPVVNTGAGQIIGVEDEFVKFLGIPYAVVDETDPFGPAQPLLLFETPYYANIDPVICPQLVKGLPQGNLQCLNLNVYTPISKYHNESLPVMVFIHGGEFKEGDGNFNTYSPVFLVKKNVIVVTINYRLGPYGFICLEHDEYKNQGLKDQSLALKWVKNNIKYFGGDENNILLFGHSAGSASAEFHLLFDKDKVFNKVILQSMQLVSPAVSGTQTSYEYLTVLAARVGLDGRHLGALDILKELSKVNTDSLVTETFYDKEWRPCVDSSMITEAAVNQDLKNIQIIVGSAANETIFFYKDELNNTNIIKRELSTEFHNVGDGFAKVENYYSSGNFTQDTLDFGSDFLINYPVERSIRHYLRSNATVYRYIFSYDGGRNFVKVRDNIDAEGATHGDELGYLFDPDIFGDTMTGTDLYVIDTITTFWTNFAKYGDPWSPMGLSTLLPWSKYDDSLFYMDIGALPILKEGYRKEQMSFWESFYKEFAVYARGNHYDEETEFTVSTNSVTKIAVTSSLSAAAIIVIQFLS